MTITYTVPGVPLLNQLNEVSNPRYDCVFTSNAALATAYLHKSFTGTEIKALDSDDYGPTYTGGASEARLTDTMSRLGITMTRTPSATQQGLVDAIHRAVASGHGVIVTMPSQWNSAVTLAGSSWNPRTYSGPSHVGLACGVGPGMIRVMNPWGGFWQDQPDAWWAQRLLEGEVWVGLPPVATGVSAMSVPAGWNDNGTTLTAPNGQTVTGGMRQYVLSYPGGWRANNLPRGGEVRVAQVEQSNLMHGPGVVQYFNFSMLALPDAPNAPAEHTVYESYIGVEAQYLRGQVETAERDLNSANETISLFKAQVADLQAQLKAAQAVNGPAQALAAAVLAVVNAQSATTTTQKAA